MARAVVVGGLVKETDFAKEKESVTRLSNSTYNLIKLEVFIFQSNTVFGNSFVSF